MIDFSISHAAMVEIHRILPQSERVDSVIRMRERADAGQLFDEWKTYALRGSKSAAEVGEIGMKRLSEVVDHLSSSLELNIEERKQFQPEELREVEGITFVMNSALAELLRGYCLSFENGHFFFLGSNGEIHTLRTLAARISRGE